VFFDAILSALRILAHAKLLQKINKSGIVRPKWAYIWLISLFFIVSTTNSFSKK
jgi:hypothetical protein